jgi:Tol biopolymer transport system component
VPRKLLDDSELGARWSVDGRRITFIRAGASAGDALWVADADGDNRREIIPADAGIHIHWPVWSSDGYVYFNRTRATGNLDQSDIYRIRADGGTPEPVVTTPRRAMFPMVAPASGGLFFASDTGSVDLGLYWRPPAGGAWVPVTHGIGDYSAASISTDGRAIVATYGELRQSLVRLTLAAAGVAQQPVTGGYTGDLDPTMAAPGNRLVFSSSRGGNRWIWISQLDGTQPRALTSGDVLDQWPSMSPDGSTVAFVSDRGGRRGIWLIASEGGSPRRLVDAESIGGLSWTHDGRAVLYAADYERWPGLFMVAVADGQVQRLPTEGVATDPACSPSEGVVAYMSPRTTGPSFTELRFVDLDGNGRFRDLPPAPPLPGGFANGVLAWSPDGRRLAIVHQNANAPASIWLIEPAAAEPRFEKLIELDATSRVRGMAWTPDARSLVVGQHDVVSDIVLIELQQ